MSEDRHWIWEAFELNAVKAGPPVFNEDTMRFYQHYMAQQIEDRSILLLAAEMGLGKTVAVLTALRRMIDSGKVRTPVLIIAPLLVAQETWPNEIEKWEHTRTLTYTLIRAEDDDDDVTEACNRAAMGERALARIEGHSGGARAKMANAVLATVRTKVKDHLRRKKMLEPTDIHIINRELLPWLRKAVKGEWPYQMIVYDEASRLKKGNKRTAKAKVKKDGEIGIGRQLSEFGTLTAVRPFVERIVELSGTPSPNGLHDLWGPAYVLDMGERLGRSMTAFNDRWFNFGRWDYSIEPKEHAFDEIMGKLSDVMISMMEKDYLELPPRIDNPVYVDLPTPTMKAYRKFERTLYLEMYDIEAVSAGVLTNKLLQFANGSIYDENGDDKPVHSLKIKALESIVEEAAGAPILVAYEFKFDLAAIRKRWPKAVMIGEKNWLKRWDRGEIDMLLCHPASASHGLNMQFGGSIGVWFGLTWSLELFQQFIKRLHRTGQKADRVWIHYILARGTADEDVWENALVKGATQERIMEAVRVRLESDG